MHLDTGNILLESCKSSVRLTSVNAFVSIRFATLSEIISQVFMYWARQSFASNVDPDQMPHNGHLIRVYTVCHLDTPSSSRTDYFKF